MSVRLTGMPAYCCACYSQNQGARHVDFEASYDGPVLVREDGIKQTVDDLVICEACLVEAFSALGLDKPIEDASKIRELEETIQWARDDIVAKERMVTRLIATVNELFDHPVKKPPGKPHFTGLPDDALVEMRTRKEARIKYGRPKKPKATANGKV